MNFTRNNLLFVFLGLIAFFGLKYYFDSLGVDEIRWILTPVAWLVEPMTGLDFVWQEGKGYFNEPKLILINKSCAGLSYLLIVMGLSVYCGLRFFHGPSAKIGAILLLLPLAYCLTVLANASRIATATLLLPLGELIAFLQTELFHYTLGMAIYLVLLVFYYRTIEYISTQTNSITDKTQ